MIKTNRMTVKELIEHLSTLDPELRVFTTGYEGGFQDAFGPDESDIKTFVLNYHTEWYYGPHEIVDLSDEEREQYKTAKGIII